MPERAIFDLTISSSYVASIWSNLPTSPTALAWSVTLGFFFSIGSPLCSSSTASSSGRGMPFIGRPFLAAAALFFFLAASFFLAAFPCFTSASGSAFGSYLGLSTYSSTSCAVADAVSACVVMPPKRLGSELPSTYSGAPSSSYPPVSATKPVVLPLAVPAPGARRSPLKASDASGGSFTASKPTTFSSSSEVVCLQMVVVPPMPFFIPVPLVRCAPATDPACPASAHESASMAARPAALRASVSGSSQRPPEVLR